jgi:serine/threonine-protein kinase
VRLDDRYRLIKQIGSGGMSVVFAADDEVLQRQVAVKMLASGPIVDPALARRLLLEARAVATLRHRHVAAVFDFGVHRADDDTVIPYLVMEMLDGELLSHVLRLGRLPWLQAASVCAELAAALAAVHAAGIVHHDISPANIMLTSTGVKVLDFGISALIGDAQPAVDGHILGTAAYMAPERLGRGQVTGSADVYAAGLVLYRCLAGRLPWNADTVAEMLHAHARLEPRRLPSLGLPRAIEDACYQCLAREPRQRPSAAELARILSREVKRAAAASVRRSDDAARPPAGDGETMTIPLTREGGSRRRPSRRVLVGAAAVCGLLALGYLLHPAGPQSAAAQADATSGVPCSITYIATYRKAHRFSAAVTVTGAASDAVKLWTLQFTLPGGESLVSRRPTTLAMQPAGNTAQVLVGQQGRQVTVTQAAALASGVPVSLTLNGHYGNALTLTPSGFTLNGKRCETAVTLRTAAQPPAGAVTVARARPAGDVPPGPHKPKKADKSEPYQGRHSRGGLST